MSSPEAEAAIEELEAKDGMRGRAPAGAVMTSPARRRHAGYGRHPYMMSKAGSHISQMKRDQSPQCISDTVVVMLAAMHATCGVLFTLIPPIPPPLCPAHLYSTLQT
jgi:hypothetical protein